MRWRGKAADRCRTGRRDPERIDMLARKLGLQSPQAGQVMHMDTVSPDAATPVLASVTPVSVVSAR